FREVCGARDIGRVSAVDVGTAAADAPRWRGGRQFTKQIVLVAGNIAQRIGDLYHVVDCVVSIVSRLLEWRSNADNAPVGIGDVRCPVADRVLDPLDCRRWGFYSLTNECSMLSPISLWRATQYEAIFDFVRVRGGSGCAGVFGKWRVCCERFRQDRVKPFGPSWRLLLHNVEPNKS